MESKDSKDNKASASTTLSDPGLAARQARRANLFLHVRVLLQYLTRVDPKLRIEAQNVSVTAHSHVLQYSLLYLTYLSGVERMPS